MKVMSAVHARIHNSFRREFKLLSRIIRDSMDQYPYEMDVDPMMLSQDFDNRIDILPVSDPNATSFAQRMMQHRRDCRQQALHHRCMICESYTDVS